jgi:hypothetical protein
MKLELSWRQVRSGDRDIERGAQPSWIWGSGRVNSNPNLIPGRRLTANFLFWKVRLPYACQCLSRNTRDPLGQGNEGHFHFHEHRRRTCNILLQILGYEVHENMCMNNSEPIKQLHNASPCVESPDLCVIGLCETRTAYSSRAARGRQGDAGGQSRRLTV